MSVEPYQNIIEKTFQDPLTDLLLKNSHLTRTQFQTLIIDLLTDIISDEKVSFNQKILFRQKRVSRGSFSRSLAQARKNVVSSIFTVVLLSYMGVFDERPFEEYHVLAEKLKEYATVIESGEFNLDHKSLARFEEKLVSGILELASPTSIKMV